MTPDLDIGGVQAERAHRDDVLVISVWVQGTKPPNVWARVRWGLHTDQVAQRQFVVVGVDATIAAINDWVETQVGDRLNDLMEGS